MLTAGKRYRVIQLFIDYDRCIHLPGEQWLFKGHDYFPHDEGTTFFVDGVDESTIRFQGDGNEILRNLDAYLAPVASEPSVAPAATRGERIMALVNAAFADLQGIDGQAQPKATPEGTPPDPPETPFVPQITPPLPVPWPAERFVYYAYARRISGGDVAHLSDPLEVPEDVSEPWARIESGSELVLVPLSGQLKLLGRQHLQPATVRQQMVFDAGARAAPLEELLLAAGKSPAVARLVRESYCKWQSHNLIASSVLQWHPDIAGFLDCAKLAKQPVAELRALLQPEFDRRWQPPNDGPNDWELCISNGFPAEWPVGWKTKISYYAAAIRYDRTSPVPRPREVTEPWGVVARDGMWRPIAFTSLTTDPKSLGIEPGKARTDSFPALHQRILEALQARQRTAIDELFFAVEKDPEIAALVGSWYRQWIDGNSLLAAWTLPRHAAFAAFINGAASFARPSNPVASMTHPTTITASPPVISVATQGDATRAATAAPVSNELPMARRHVAHTATLLPNGKVLLAGGGRDPGDAVYDPSTSKWSPAASLATSRAYHTATLLPDGKVLIAGGTSEGKELASAEIYDPSCNSWSSAGSLEMQRERHTATLLPNGKLLVTGGRGISRNVSSAELYDPSSNAWSSAGKLAKGRFEHTATLLPSGKVLVVGGWGGSPYLSSAELYDPSCNTWSDAGSLTTAREGHTATLLAGGKVLVVGGQNGRPHYVANAELYDPSGNTWSSAGNLAKARDLHTATLLASGKVLVAGGSGVRAGLVGAELYDPSSNTWSDAGALTTPREEHTATLLPNGKVLVTGGKGSLDCLYSDEFYDPSNNTWSSRAP